ncbi:YlzJ-like family protein [Bacillus dakarensis]|uniref:YlzJ-like family protein n=1 Tax=Robertmurraya dakarensis TaxID=1926278 RepID=UPI00098168CD|nr:YlzJ-like family protein [Bacillus dakarensis]
MILYTMMPQELVFPTNNEVYDNLTQIDYEGIPLMVERTDDHAYRVVRVMSTNPDHFLDSRCLPGSKISI